MAERGEFLAIGHEFGAFAHVRAIDAKNLVVGAGGQHFTRVVRLAAERSRYLMPSRNA